MIPKIVHQIYWNFHVKDGEMPASWRELSQKCRELYEKNDWKYYLWGKRDSDLFIRSNFPWLRKKWFYSANIAKVDILRYAIMYVYGGMYLDLDTKCVKVYSPKSGTQIILGATSMAKNPILGKIYGINNNILLSVPNHPFWQSILHHINICNISEFWPKFIRISMYTGPYRLQNIYENYPDKKGILVLPELSVGKSIDTDTYFIHDSMKSWVSIPDAIHLGLFLVMVPIAFKPFLLGDKTYLVASGIIILILVFLLNRKNLPL